MVLSSVVLLKELHITIQTLISFEIIYKWTKAYSLMFENALDLPSFRAAYKYFTQTQTLLQTFTLKYSQTLTTYLT